jgi:hypothetical protein
MIDRQQLESILVRRFPGAPLSQVAAAANAIMGLDRDAAAGRPSDKGHRGPVAGVLPDGHEVAPRVPASTP